MFKILIFFLSLSGSILSQYNLDYFIKNALANSPRIKNFNNLFFINDLQKKIDEAENSALRVYLTADYLFAPYFNNDKLISINPAPEAIGYDVGITNGGLYSALLNVEKNIFNGALLNALNEQRTVQGKSYENQKLNEEHDLIKLITDQYLNTFQYLELYSLSKEIVNNLQNRLKISGDLVTKGLSDMHSYLLLKVEARSQQINLDQTHQNYIGSLLQLYSISGINDTQIVSIDSVNLSLSTKVEDSRFLTQYYLDSLSAAAQQNIFETGYLPQIKLFFNTGLNAVELNDIQNKFGLSAGINLSMPILDGGKKDLMRQQTLISENSTMDFKNFAAKNIFVQRRS
ncbi:MAG TPA: TolC family protein, partial [Ignavibacteriaceae bacterium]|nr:TolC family protein [Ignavibacteriaceae bacterium]